MSHFILSCILRDKCNIKLSHKKDEIALIEKIIKGKPSLISLFHIYQIEFYYLLFFPVKLILSSSSNYKVSINCPS